MNLVGKWKVSKLMRMDEDFQPYWQTEEEFRNSPDQDPEIAGMFKTALFFDESTVSMLMAIPDGVPQSEIDEAATSGEVEIMDIDGTKFMKAKGETWKEEDGSFYMEAGVDGETNEVCWDPIKVIGEDPDEIEIMAIYHFIRA